MVVRVRARRSGARREARRLRRSLAGMMAQLAPGKDLELSVSLVSDEEMTALNSEYMGLDEPTDVLSFPLLSREEVEGLDASGIAPEPVGDIVINLDAAARQAGERGLSRRDEVELLAAHGLLHLFGYDHLSPSETAEMARKERSLLGRSIIGDGTGED
ncbi:MAG TPA: rRNA maturation RNase YbeY [Candidatus Anoxymicrobiaceae bacterium]|jgi:probable rRNA maturation factor